MYLVQLFRSEISACEMTVADPDILNFSICFLLFGPIRHWVYIYLSRENEVNLQNSFPILHALLNKLMGKYQKNMQSKVTYVFYYLANFCSVIYHFIRFANLTFSPQSLFLQFKKSTQNGSNLVLFRKAPSIFDQLVGILWCIVRGSLGLSVCHGAGWS